jgi:hypothetical protein
LCTSAIFFSAFRHCILCFLSKVNDNNTNKTNHKNNGGSSISSSNNPRFDWVVVVVVMVVMKSSSSFQCQLDRNNNTTIVMGFITSLCIGLKYDLSVCHFKSTP